MRRYAAKRLAMLIPVMIGVSVIIFILMRLMPGDATAARLGENATQKDVAELKQMFGLDQPLHMQYLTWASKVFRGDLGRSFLRGDTVWDQLGRRAPVTIELALMSIIIAALVGIPLGVISGIRQNSLIDFAARLVCISGISVPLFWIGTMFLIVSGRFLNWVPPLTYVRLWEDPAANLTHFVVPAIFVAYRTMGVNARMARSAILEVLREDYIRTAWSKGLKERVVIIRHTLKNAMIPCVTIAGNEFALLLGGTVIAETIFSLPGLGRLMLSSITARDYPIVQGVVLVLAVAVVLINLMVDLTYAWFDPRVRYR